MEPNKKAPAGTGAHKSHLYPQTTTRIEDLDIRAVWTALGGGPLRGGRGRAFWRNGDGFHIALDASKSVFYDQARHEGGGIVRLVEIAIGCDRRAALAWLADNFGISVGASRTPQERREYARRREQAWNLASTLVAQRDATIEAIRAKERQHLDRYHQLEREAMPTQDMELAWRAEREMEAADELMALRDQLAMADGPTLAKLFSMEVAA